MKNAIIFHGWGETPESFWFPYLKKELEKKGYQVLIPMLPETNNPYLGKWLETALREQYSSQTILIGHSLGCPLILNILQRLNLKIKKAILVGGFYTPLGIKVSDRFVQEEFDWEKIKQNCDEFVFINSNNDPYKCNDKHGRYAFDHLGGTLIINNEGHMGSENYKQPYKEFPFLLKLID